MIYKRITLLCGHYGSGKTNVAVNMSADLKKQYDNVAIADLDIVNPYFRTKDSSDYLKEKGIRLICSDYANTNLDIPALPQDMYAITDDRALHCVVDIGGDDRGALALGRLVPSILSENDYEMIMVVNKYRPLTPDIESTIEVMREIEYAGQIKFTAIINNSNLGEETTADDVLDSLEYANALSKETNLPILATSINESLLPSLEGKIDNLFPMRLQEKKFKIDI